MSAGDTIREFIRRTRKGHKLSQKEFGKVLGVSAGMIYGIEKGRKGISEDILNKFCQEFDIDIKLIRKCENS